MRVSYPSSEQGRQVQIRTQDTSVHLIPIDDFLPGNWAWNIWHLNHWGCHGQSQHSIQPLAGTIWFHTGLNILSDVQTTLVELDRKINNLIPVVPARGRAEVALGIYYKTFLIYRTCMRRACILRNFCTVSHVTFEVPLRTSHFSLHSSHSTLHTSHFISFELFSPYPSSSLLISSLHISSHMSSKLSWITSQYYFENLHAPCASQARACMLCEKLLRTASFLNREAFTYRSFYTQQAFTQRSFYTQQAFTHSKRLHRALLHRVLLHMASVYTLRSLYTEKLLHTEKLLLTASFYTQNRLHTASFYRKKIHIDTHRSFLVHNDNTNCSSKTGWISTPKRKKTISKHFLKGLKWKITSAKIEQICWQITAAALIQPLQYYVRDPAAKDNSLYGTKQSWRNHYNAICRLSCKAQ